MPSVRVRENEYFDAALRRFKRACEKAGVLTELRRREFYEKPTQERKRKKAAAVKRHMKRVSREVMRPAPLSAPPADRMSRSKSASPEDMKAAMRAGEKERLGVHSHDHSPPSSSAKSTSASRSTMRRCSPCSRR